MAAPCLGMVVRSMWQFRNINRTSTTLLKGIRHFSSSGECSCAVKLKYETHKPASQWKLYGAVCLQRLPVVSQDPNPIEQKFVDIMQQMELERSRLSDHELRLLEDAERMSRKQEEDYDSDDEDLVNQEIVTAQDDEDAWEQKLKRFQPTGRANGASPHIFNNHTPTGAAGEDPSSLDRCLSDSLVLLVQQEVGKEKVWLLPQLQWTTGETLRQTAERALASLPGTDLKARFLGNSPCGVYKFKFPKGVQTESCVGAKVFFFKALLSSGTNPTSEKGAFVWVKKSELKGYLKPDYLRQADRFILGL
ncbi:large ribosomal subunit protein mL46 isoform X1 [Alosa pseudoharengus]|uniref:large ribosomal subunit protein mL46 isoform X1 n=1 Tax=Alosa pseudoharengus TaxID=34774 RepID=UPI003F894F33